MHCWTLAGLKCEWLILCTKDRLSDTYLRQTMKTDCWLRQDATHSRFWNLWIFDRHTTLLLAPLLADAIPLPMRPVWYNSEAGAICCAALSSLWSQCHWHQVLVVNFWEQIRFRGIIEASINVSVVSYLCGGFSLCLCAFLSDYDILLLPFCRWCLIMCVEFVVLISLLLFWRQVRLLHT